MFKKIATFFLLILLLVFKYHLILFYFFIKIFTKQKRQVFLLSRQSNELSINYSELIKSLEKENIKYKVICKKVPDGINRLLRNEANENNLFKELGAIFSYYFNLYKQMYYISTSKVVIIDGFNITISILKHKKNTLIIQMWHALGAVKKFGYQTINKNGVNPMIAKILCMHKNYNYVLGGSAKSNEYFAEAFNVKPEQILNIGTPIVQYLKKENTKKLLRDFPALKKKKNILYCPTFRKNKVSKIDEIIKCINFSNYNLIISCHPKDIKNIDNRNVIVANETLYSTQDFLKVCDYVITDYSAISIEALILNKKILFYVYDYEYYKNEVGINIDLYHEIDGNVSINFNDLYDIIENDNYNNESYAIFRDKYLPNIEINSTTEITKIIKENL